MKFSLNKLVHEKIFTEFPISNFGLNNYLPLIYSRYNFNFNDYNLNDANRLLTESFSRKLMTYIEKELVINKLESNTNLDDYVDFSTGKLDYYWKFPFTFELNFSHKGKDPQYNYWDVAYYEIANRSEHYWVKAPYDIDLSENIIPISDIFSDGNDEFYPDWDYLSFRYDFKDDPDVPDGDIKKIIDKYDGKGYDGIVINTINTLYNNYFLVYINNWQIHSLPSCYLDLISNKELTGDAKYYDVDYGTMNYKGYKKLYSWTVDSFIDNFKKLIHVFKPPVSYFRTVIRNNYQNDYPVDESIDAQKGYYFLFLKGKIQALYYGMQYWEPYCKTLFFSIQPPLMFPLYFTSDLRPDHAVPDILFKDDIVIKFYLLYNGILKEYSNIFI